MKTIGLCDSGIGGLLVLFALHKAYPKLNMTFLADQSHVPYGDKTYEQLKGYAVDLFDEFRRRNIQDVVIACNTLCANVLEEVRNDYSDLNLIGIIAPTVAQLRQIKAQKVLVLATKKTVEKHAYRKAIHEMMPEVIVEEIACPKLVPLIEGHADPKELRQAVYEYIEGKEFDACILGCTHFPLISEYIHEQKQVPIFDSNQAVIDLLKDEKIEGEGKIEIFTTHDAYEMQEVIQRLFGETIQVQEISLK